MNGSECTLSRSGAGGRAFRSGKTIGEDSSTHIAANTQSSPRAGLNFFFKQIGTLEATIPPLLVVLSLTSGQFFASNLKRSGLIT
jgi:hypothetical protein